MHTGDVLLYRKQSRLSEANSIGLMQTGRDPRPMPDRQPLLLRTTATALYGYHYSISAVPVKAPALARLRSIGRFFPA